MSASNLLRRVMRVSFFLWLGWVFSPPASAQPEWWTLTDMTPEELRAIHEDRAETEKRYRRLVAEGKTEAPEDEAEYGRMAMVYLGSDTPELVPLWHAFKGFAGSFASNPKTKQSLLRAGMSREGAEVIVHYGVYLPQWRQAEGDAWLRAIEPWMEALRAAQADLGEAGYREAVERDEAARLGAYGSLGVEESREYMELWRSQPIRDMTLARLEDLREQVSEEDWEIFRNFLLREIAPHRLWFLPEDLE